MGIYGRGQTLTSPTLGGFTIDIDDIFGSLYRIVPIGYEMKHYPLDKTHASAHNVHIIHLLVYWGVERMGFEPTRAPA